MGRTQQYSWAVGNGRRAATNEPITAGKRIEL